MIFQKKTAGMGPGSRIFFNFCDFFFHGLTLGHVSGHMGTCHVDVQQIRIEGLGNYSMHDPWSIKNKITKVE